MSANIVKGESKFSYLIKTDNYQNMIKTALSDPKRVMRFIASITSTVAVTPALQECDASTILSGALLGESLNLSPSPQLGQFYLVPFEVKKKDNNGKNVYVYDANGEHVLDDKGKWKVETKKIAEFVLGYKGYIQLAMRSGQYADIDALEIKEGEYLGRDNITGKHKFSFIEDDDVRDELPTVGYLAYYEYLNGARKTIYWSKDKMMKHADKYSPAFSKDAFEAISRGEVAEKDMWKYSSHWYKDFDGMAKKTLLRQLIGKWGIMSADMVSAFENDGAAVEQHDGVFLPMPGDNEGEDIPDIPSNNNNPDVIPDAKMQVKKVNLDEI